MNNKVSRERPFVASPKPRRSLIPALGSHRKASGSSRKNNKAWSSVQGFLGLLDLWGCCARSHRVVQEDQLWRETQVTDLGCDVRVQPPARWVFREIKGCVWPLTPGQQ